MAPYDLTSLDLAILGGGNLGHALAYGWVREGPLDPSRVVVTRRTVERIRDLEGLGMSVTDDNREAVDRSRAVVLAVQPQQLPPLLDEIREALDPKRHRVISVVSGVALERLREGLGIPDLPVVRAMPNTAVAIGEAMTCVASDPGPTRRGEGDEEALSVARALFGSVGRTLLIPESMMSAATALSACGVAFFLRCIRAASQGGIEIGFHPEEALLLASQTARGAASLLREAGRHPESEIDRVTTPRGCTIAGLNEMEHHGLSSALIRGIIVSARQAEGLADEPGPPLPSARPAPGG